MVFGVRSCFPVVANWDLVGGFPVTQRIERISAIQVWGRDRVEGIEVTYILKPDPFPQAPHQLIHGLKSGLAHPAIPINGRTRGCFLYSLPQLIALSTDRQFLVGVYGQRNTLNNIGSINFVVFEEDSGRVEVKGRVFKHLKWWFLGWLDLRTYYSGPFGSPPRPGTAYGTFGPIVAFAGTEESACKWTPVLLQLLT